MTGPMKRWHVTGQVVMVAGIDAVVYAPTEERAREAARTRAYADHDDVSEIILSNVRELGLHPDEAPAVPGAIVGSTILWVLSIAEDAERWISLHVNKEDAVRTLAGFCRSRRRPTDSWIESDSDTVIIDACCSTRYLVTMDSTILGPGQSTIVLQTSTGCGGGAGG